MEIQIMCHRVVHQRRLLIQKEKQLIIYLNDVQREQIV